MRREDIRRNRPDALRLDWDRWKQNGVPGALGIAAAFFVCATIILLWRQDVIPYRPGQWIPHNIVSRVAFRYFDQDLFAYRQFQARDREPRVYRAALADPYAELQRTLLELPERAANGPDGLPEELRPILDGGTITALQQYLTPRTHQEYARDVDAFIQDLRDYRLIVGGRPSPLILLPPDERREDVRSRRDVRIIGAGANASGGLGSAAAAAQVIPASRTYPAHSDELRPILRDLADRHFLLALQPKIVDVTIAALGPTDVFDPTATDEAKNNAAAAVAQAEGNVFVPADEIFISKKNGVFDQQDWLKLRAENRRYIASLKGSKWKSWLGTAMLAFIVTTVLAAYIALYQPKIVRNHARLVGIAALLLSMLLLAQMTGLWSGPLFLLGVAPTVLVAMILTIAYEQRFSVGIASMHGMLATVALQQGVMFFIVIWVGVLTACLLLGDIRSRSKLIEIGGAMAIAMMIATLAAGFMGFDPWRFVAANALYAGAAGLAVGFIVLGVLPFLEKAFRITTSMTLLELADASQPLQRRLQIEAPGTYNHSLQVAAIAEAAAEAIGANSLLCRVGAYYHDIGKIHKAEYFVENQGGGENRHLNLNPSVSLLIIIGHVKDGMELAREYNLPTSLFPFIQQHHGTTLVEYFYHRACKREQPQDGRPGGPTVSETQYRYPGPKPRTREVAIVMIADAAESACRALPEPTASRVESLVHDLIMKRLLDGQFDECDLTMRDLDRIERSVMKSLLGIYHGRIQYPSTAAITGVPAAATPTIAAAAAPGMKTA